MDCLIVVGTALATSGARSLVFRTLNRQTTPVIEVNIEPQCNVSYALQVTEKCETALPHLFDQYYSLSNQAATGPKTVTKPTPLGTLKPSAVTMNGKSSLSPVGGKIQAKPISTSGGKIQVKCDHGKPSMAAKPIVKK